MSSNIKSILSHLTRKATKARADAERLAKVSIELGKRRLDDDSLRYSKESSHKRHEAEQLDIRVARFKKLEANQTVVVYGRG